MTSISGFAEFADDAEEMADALDEAADALEDELDTALEETAERISQDAQRRAPVDTGDLQQSIHTDRTGPLTHRVVASADHARPVEYGTAPHPITPNDAEALRFVIDGEVIYSSHVDHPGTSKQPYLRPALESNRSTLRQTIRRAIRRALRDALR